MAIETERKFLVQGEFLHLATGKSEIVQTYITVDHTKTIRLRIADEKAFLTIKSKPEPGRFSRDEWEFEIPVESAKEMMKICMPGKIVKTRYYVPSGKHTIEVDVFHDKNEGLVIAEIELGSEDEFFIKPVWLGEEVTGQKQYYNAYLIK